MEKLGNFISAFIKGKTPKVLYSEKAEGLHPYVSPDYLRGKGNPEFFAAMTNKTIPLEDDEIIILWDGSNAGEVLLSKKGILASTMVKLLVDETKLDKKYFAYSCLNLEYILKAKTAGSGIPHADKGVIKNLPFYFPTDKAEQTAIAKILSTVDEAIRSTRETISKLERVKKSLMQNLLSGKMKPDGTLRPAAEFYEDDKMGLVPKGWKIIKGNKITTKITKGQSPKWQGFEYQSEGILFVTSENIQDGYIDYSKEKYLPLEFNDKIKNSQLQNGDILINIVGASIGRCAVFKKDDIIANTNQAVCVFRPDNDNDSDFLALYIQLEHTQKRLFRNQVETARANLSLGDFRKFKFVIPEDKQEQIAVSTKINELNISIENKYNKITKLELLKKSLMQQLLTGRVRVK